MIILNIYKAELNCRATYATGNDIAKHVQKICGVICCLFREMSDLSSKPRLQKFTLFCTEIVNYNLRVDKRCNDCLNFCLKAYFFGILNC